MKKVLIYICATLSLTAIFFQTSFIHAEAWNMNWTQYDDVTTPLFGYDGFIGNFTIPEGQELTFDTEIMSDGPESNCSDWIGMEQDSDIYLFRGHNATSGQVMTSYELTTNEIPECPFVINVVETSNEFPLQAGDYSLGYITAGNGNVSGVRVDLNGTLSTTTPSPSPSPIPSSSPSPDPALTPTPAPRPPSTRRIFVQESYQNTGNKNNIATPASGFTKSLWFGTFSTDVRNLQQFLNAAGFLVAPAGYPGSSGYETNYFGPATQTALIAYQKARGIIPAIGYFGPITRGKIFLEQIGR